MSDNVRPWRWTKRRERVALLVALDELPEPAIAAEAGVTDRQVRRWKQHPDFARRVAEHREVWRQQVRAEGIAIREKRIEQQNARWRALREAVRAWAEEYKDAPGGARSGYYARQVAVVKVLGQFEEDERGRAKFVPTGEQTEVEQWALDTGLLKELRELEKQAAIELEQWKEQREDKLTGLEEFAKALREFGRASADA